MPSSFWVFYLMKRKPQKERSCLILEYDYDTRKPRILHTEWYKYFVKLGILFKLKTNLDILRFWDCNIFIHVIRYGSSSHLPGYLDIRTFARKWIVLVGPGCRKPFKCFPGLLWHDVIQWRMDHVLHYWWICQTQDWSHIQHSVSLWKWRLQDQL